MPRILFWVAVVSVTVYALPHAKAGRVHELDVPPVRSGDFRYAGVAPTPVRVVVEDARQRKGDFVWEKGAYFSALQVKLVFPGGSDPVSFLAESIATELSKRGIPASANPGSGGETMKLRVETFDVRYHQSYGSPVNTFTHLRLVATYRGKTHVVSGYVVRSRYFAMTRKNKPRLNYLYPDAVHLVVREAAAKLNRLFWNLSVPDAVVGQMIAAASKASDDDKTIRLADLACTNNRRATKHLTTLVEHPDQASNRTALWGLGVLGTASSVPLLHKKGMEGDSGQALMTVKALGDIGTPEARAAMKAIDSAKRPTFSAYGVEELNALRELYRGVESQSRPVGAVVAPVGAVVAPVGTGAARGGSCFPPCRGGYVCDPTSDTCVPVSEAPPPTPVEQNDACFPPCRAGFVCDQARAECVQETTAAPPSDAAPSPGAAAPAAGASAVGAAAVETPVVGSAAVETPAVAPAATETPAVGVAVVPAPTVADSIAYADAAPVDTAEPEVELEGDRRFRLVILGRVGFMGRFTNVGFGYVRPNLTPGFALRFEKPVHRAVTLGAAIGSYWFQVLDGMKRDYALDLSPFLKPRFTFDIGSKEAEVYVLVQAGGSLVLLNKNNNQYTYGNSLGGGFNVGGGPGFQAFVASNIALIVEFAYQYSWWKVNKGQNTFTLLQPTFRAGLAVAF